MTHVDQMLSEAPTCSHASWSGRDLVSLGGDDLVCEGCTACEKHNVEYYI